MGALALLLDVLPQELHRRRQVGELLVVSRSGRHVRDDRSPCAQSHGELHELQLRRERAQVHEQRADIPPLRDLPGEPLPGPRMLLQAPQLTADDRAGSGESTRVRVDARLEPQSCGGDGAVLVLAVDPRFGGGVTADLCVGAMLEARHVGVDLLRVDAVPAAPLTADHAQAGVIGGDEPAQLRSIDRVGGDDERLRHLRIPSARVHHRDLEVHVPAIDQVGERPGGLDGFEEDEELRSHALGEQRLELIVRIRPTVEGERFSGVRHHPRAAAAPRGGRHREGSGALHQRRDPADVVSAFARLLRERDDVQAAVALHDLVMHRLEAVAERFEDGEGGDAVAHPLPVGLVERLCQEVVAVRDELRRVLRCDAEPRHGGRDEPGPVIARPDVRRQIRVAPIVVVDLLDPQVRHPTAVACRAQLERVHLPLQAVRAASIPPHGRADAL